MLLRLVTPTAIGARGTEVGDGDDNGGRALAVLGAAGVARKLKASAAGEAGVEQSLAESCGVRAIACAVEVSVSTRSAWTESYHSFHRQICALKISKLTSRDDQRTQTSCIYVLEFLNVAHILVYAHG